MSKTHTVYIVYPCAQWRKEYPHQIPMMVWEHSRFAAESRDDTEGFRVKVTIRMKNV